MASYTVTIRETSWKKIQIESDEPLTDEEREEIESQGEDGIPQRFLGEVQVLDEGGEFPSYVSIDED